MPTLPDYDTRLHRLAGSWADRFDTFETALANSHPLTDRHDYLAFLAVHPARQHWGPGTRLMEHRHRVLDQQRLPAYLEAASWHSYDFYRLQGWSEHGEPYLVAADGPAMYPMRGDMSPPPGQPFAGTGGTNGLQSSTLSPCQQTWSTCHTGHP